MVCVGLSGFDECFCTGFGVQGSLDQLRLQGFRLQGFELPYRDGTDYRV